MTACIDIVLATYNGEQYLEAQLSSIIDNEDALKLVKQIIISDDNSTDKTPKLLKRLQKKSPIVITILPPSPQQLGASQNFAKALQASTSPYIMLCDQDDIWHDKKIRQSLDKLKEMEKNKADSPNLVFSDLKVVDDNLKEISNSYFKLKNIDLDWHKSFIQLLQQNCISGCSMAFNKHLLDLCLPIPKNAYMHDWWLALYASAYGEIVRLDETQVSYRQHSNNTIGATRQSFITRLLKIRKNWYNFELSFKKIRLQAQEFKQHNLHYYNLDSTPEEVKRCLDLLASVERHGFLYLLTSWFKGDLKRSHLIANIVLLCLLIKLKIGNSH